MGWSGPTCEDCTKQQNCPISANCSEPAGCFCEDVQNGTPCMIENAPPRLTTKYNVPKHYMTRECTRFNSQQLPIVERPKPRSLIDGNSFEIKFYNIAKNICFHLKMNHYVLNIFFSRFLQRYKMCRSRREMYRRKMHLWRKGSM